MRRCTARPGSWRRPPRSSKLVVNAPKPPSARKARGRPRCGRRREPSRGGRRRGAVRRPRRRGRRTRRRGVSTAASPTAATASTRSLTPHVLTETPKRISASTLSPSVTATSRMLSPKRASFRRAQVVPAGGGAGPARRRRRARRGRRRGRRPRLRSSPCGSGGSPNSRSPWAAWLRFMKSMSMLDHGRRRLACVCRCSSGLARAWRPAIHIFAGENVCIQAMTPMQPVVGGGVEAWRGGSRRAW